ncbi:hypothetical protein VTJ83DRAFT_2664 [Remersonia thermophila]|uniref:3',5'-cyclic-nucleotide phosphodiesterase n=1 Tax=Remersonia thermophila TaxID=72144 RepID=A0ABR4DK02_9PEZI
MAGGTRRRSAKGPPPPPPPPSSSSATTTTTAAAAAPSPDPTVGAPAVQPVTTALPTPAPARDPALQVIVLGSGGGPLENNVTAFLVRSVSAGWSNSSVVAVDAGVHLGAIKTILERTLPPDLGQRDGTPLPHTLTTGPFAGLEVPFSTADANAAYIHKHLIDTYLITHPHLDHIAGFVINTAALAGDRPKKLAGLPTTITAIKTHIFNNVIWPNLSDENNGAGLVTYQRLVDGGSPVLGEGPARGYAEMCPGLQVKVMSVSHGHCIERHTHRGSSRHPSIDASAAGGYNTPSRSFAAHTSISTNIGALLQQHERLNSPCGRRGSGYSIVDETACVYESSVYFLRSMATGREILIFGDVEPDSISLSPRNRQVWKEVAPKVATGDLAAIFLECSFDDAQPVERLFGHLAPRFIVEEMRALAEEVVALRDASSKESAAVADKKRKRLLDDEGLAYKRKSSTPQSAPPQPFPDTPLSPGSFVASRRVSVASCVSDSDLGPSLQQVQAQQQEYVSKSAPRSPHPLRGVVGPIDGGASSGTATTARRARPRPLTLSRNLHLRDDSDLDAYASTPQHSEPSPTSGDPNPLAFPAELAQQHQQRPVASPDLRNALAGLKVVIIHVKNRMTDGVPAQDVILDELERHEREERLGVEYVMSRAGLDLFL